ncbi:MAG: hypothetical protein AB7S26_36645 [Sandaracinaceae bacterium]
MTDARRILAGDDEAIDALHRLDEASWRALLEHAFSRGEEEAPAELIVALLRRDPSLEGWLARAKSAAAIVDSPLFTTMAKALRPFTPWLRAGVTRHAPSDSPAGQAARLAALEANAGDTLDDLPALVAETAADPARVALHARALSLLARRCLEADRIEEGIEAAGAARAALEGRDGSADARRARRLHGAALLCGRRLEEGFAVLDAAMEAATLHASPFASRWMMTGDPVESALRSLAESALFSGRGSPDWVVALGTLREAFARAGEAEEAETVRARFDAALATMVGAEETWTAETDAREAARRARDDGSEATAQAIEAARPMGGVTEEGIGGAALLLRIETRDGGWLRVHADGALETADGDARRDRARSSQGVLPADLLARAVGLRDALYASLTLSSLTTPRSGGRGYAVQAFGRTPPAFVEGRVDLEREMGRTVEVIGLRRDAQRAAECVATIEALLARG